MSTIDKYLRMPLTLFEMGEMISNLPSPRKRFFQIILAVSGLSPNTVKMILCSTQTGIYPRVAVCKKIAKALGKDESVLFPSERIQSGSLVDTYRQLSAKKVEMHQFIDLLSTATRASPKTVRKWLKRQKVPSNVARRDIAKVIGASIEQLFPAQGN